MGQLFSTRKKPQITDVDRAILTLKTQKRKLVDYQRKVETVVERENDIIKELIKAKQKDRAIIALRRKKIQEEMLQKASVWAMNVEEQLANIEIASQQQQVFDSLKKGHEAIKQLQSHISLEAVQKLVDDTAEAKAYQEEINATMGDQLTEEDEAAVLEELNALEIELGLDELEELEDIELPSVPTKVPTKPDALIQENSDSEISNEHLPQERLEEPLAA